MRIVPGLLIAGAVAVSAAGTIWMRTPALAPVESVQRTAAAPLPPALDKLVERLLARRPQDRPAASAVVQQLVTLEIGTIGRRKSA